MMNYDEALQALNEQHTIDAVYARDMNRTVWVAEWHIPGCLSESMGFNRTKLDAIEDALTMCGHVRGAKSDLMRYGQTCRTHPDAYVSHAITTITRYRLRDLL